MLIRAGTRIVASLLLALIAAAASAADIWYEDNNLGSARGMPADFVDKFRQPESFRQASRKMSVYMIRTSVLEQMDNQFLETLLDPYLKGNNIKLAIDAGGATWAQMPGRAKISQSELVLLRRLKSLGIQVDYLSLQSALSKPLRREGRLLDYPMSNRIEDIVSFSKAVRSIYPKVAIGIIDALPSHGEDYREPYRLLKEALARQSIGLSHIHVDMPFDLIRAQRSGVTWQTLREVERYVKDELGVKFGFVATSPRGGNTSSQAFHNGVMSAIECYAGAAGSPNDYIIASWFPHPENTIPETASGNDYPAMRTVLEFGRRLEQIERGGPSRAMLRAGEPAWRAMCTTH